MTGQGLLVATLAVSVATLMMAVVAAVYAWRTHRLKSGIDVRGSFSLMSSIAAEDKYVHAMTLENLKDRAVVIFQVLLEIDHGYYIEVDEFEDNPLILGPFEAFRRQYEPMDQYSVNMRRIRMNDLLGDPRIRQRLVLSTSQGRYNVRRFIDGWNPTGDYFRNHLTAVIYPMRSVYEGKAYGSGTKYVVRLVTEGGDEEVIPIHPRDDRVTKFRGFRLTAESLESKDALETFLLEQAVKGDLWCSDLAVFDLEEWRSEVYSEYDEDVIEATHRGWFTYHVIGRVLTWRDDLKLRRENRANRKRLREILRTKQGST